MACAIAAILLDARVGQSADQLTLLDGKRIEATVEAIDDQGRLRGAGLEASIDLQGLRRLTREVTQETGLKPQAELHLLGGGVIRCTSLTISGESFVLKWKHGEMTLPLEAARGCKFSGEGNEGHPADTPQGRKMLKAAIAKNDDKDHLLTVVDGKVQDLDGLLLESDGKRFEFEWNGKARLIAASNVYGMVLAKVGKPHDPIGECAVGLRDGSSLTGRVQSLKAGKLKLRLTKDLVVDIPWGEVTAINVRSDRMIFLSDMKPLEARHTPVVTLLRPYQADRNVIGGSLTIGKRTFEKGLGVQSLSELVFAVDRRFNTLAATIGIDRAAQGRGDCEFVILADGKEIFRKRMRGTDTANDIRLELKNVKRITLMVAPGKNLDLSDYANWCEVRLLRSDADD